MICNKSQEQICSTKLVCRLALLLSLAQWFFFVQPCYSIDKGRVMLDVGLTFGTKTGALIGMKYFVAEDVAVGIDLIGVPISDVVQVGISLDASYYPPVFFEYAYIRTGLSYMFGTTSILAANLACGANTPKFGLPPVVESENKNDVPSVVYIELGLGLILRQKVRMSGVVPDSADQVGSSNWHFPNVELGLRQGPV